MGVRGQGAGAEDRNKTTKCNTQSFKRGFNHRRNR